MEESKQAKKERKQCPKSKEKQNHKKSGEKRKIRFQKCTVCQEKCKGKEIRGGEEVKRASKSPR